MDSQPWGDGGFAVTRAQEPSPAPPPAPRRRRSPWIVTGTAVAAMIALLVVISPWDAQRRQAIADQLTVWTNPPSAEIEQLAEATGMSETGRRIFFASLPSLEDAEDFNAHCGIEGGTVLGCYDGERIFVFRVTDDRLAGTNEVTAAHEMLHAAYARLSGAQRERIDALVQAFVARLSRDDPVLQLVEGYPARQRPDEWHSRLGTEFAVLGPELEAHYAEYFEDRSAVVRLGEEATSELRGLEERIESLVAQIDALGAELDERSTRYDQRLARLNADIDDFNERADSGWFTSQAQFDAERAVLTERSEALETERLALNADVDRYNQLVLELQGLDASYADLYSSLSSRP